jgi:hypothetical protein
MSLPFNLYVINESRKYMIKGIMDKRKVSNHAEVIEKAREEIITKSILPNNLIISLAG